MSAPGLLEQWQLQQRAQKEAERLQKSKSVEMHKQFRGGVSEEELKLRQLKEEERLKKLETEQILHGYKGGVKDEDLYLTALRNEERQKKAEAIKHHHGYRLSAEDMEKREQRQRGGHQYPSPVKIDRSDPRDSIEQGAVNRLKETYNSPSPTNIKGIMSPSSIPNSLKSPSIDLVDSPARAGVAVEALARNQNLEAGIPTGETTDVATTVNGQPVDIGASQASSPTEKIESSNEDDALCLALSQTPSSTERAAMYFDADVTTPRNLYTEQASSDNSSPKIIRFDVNISFGVITTSDVPCMDRYMQAVTHEVESLLEDSPTVSKEVVVNPRYTPFVKDMQWDATYHDPENRVNVRRCLVSAAVPIFMTDTSNIFATRKSIVNRLQGSIKTGSFLSIALSKQ